MEILGIDIGGTGIKGAIVDTKAGKLVSERYRISTPTNPTPEQITLTIKEIVTHFKWRGIVGAGFPAVVKKGTICTAANIDKSNIGINAQNIFKTATQCPFFVLNDADAAAFAEVKFGAGWQQSNTTILVLTIGTGIGSAIIRNNVLLPNTEFGHLLMPTGIVAEHFCSNLARKKEQLSWKTWAIQLNEYLDYVKLISGAELIILGGGVSKKLDKYKKYINPNTNLVPAKLFNDAGIIGAALFAIQQQKQIDKLFK